MQVGDREPRTSVIEVAGSDMSAEHRYDLQVDQARGVEIGIGEQPFPCPVAIGVVVGEGVHQHRCVNDAQLLGGTHQTHPTTRSATGAAEYLFDSRLGGEFIEQPDQVLLHDKPRSAAR